MHKNSRGGFFSLRAPSESFCDCLDSRRGPSVQMVYVSCPLRDGGTSVRKCLFLPGWVRRGVGAVGGVVVLQHNSSQAYFRRFKATRFSGRFEETLPGSAQERWRRWWRESDWLKLISHLWPMTGDSRKAALFLIFLLLMGRLRSSPAWSIRFVSNIGGTSEKLQSAWLQKAEGRRFWVAANVGFRWMKQVSKAGSRHSVLLVVSCLQIYDFRPAEGTQTLVSQTL